MPEPSLTLRGQSTLRFFGLPIYQAQLRTTQDFVAAHYEQYPLELSLTYARKLDGKLIAERSLIEMRRIGAISPAQGQSWLALMVKAFPDVVAGDQLTGSHDGAGNVQFLCNAQPRAHLQDATFARLFFGIWLHPNTSQPAMRNELLGIAA